MKGCTDLLTRLETACQKGREDIEPWQCDPFLFGEAAAEIKRLTADMAGDQQRLFHYEAENEQLRTILRAARKHVDPVEQYRLADAIAAALERKPPYGWGDDGPPLDKPKPSVAGIMPELAVIKAVMFGKEKP